MKDEIYVIGHRRPDTDSIVSAKLMANILRYKGFNAHPVIMQNDQIEQNEKSFISNINISDFRTISDNDIKSGTFYLVDHNDVAQSINFNANIIGCIDHHILSQFAKENIKNVIISDRVSCALAIYEKYKWIIPFTEQEKNDILLATMSDSKFEMSSYFTNQDKILLDSLQIPYNTKQLFNKFFIFSSTDDKKLLSQNFRNIQIGRNLYQSGTLELPNTNHLNTFINKIKKSDYENYLGIYCDRNKNETFVIIKEGNKIKKEKYNGIISRKKIIKDLEENDKEKIKEENEEELS